MSQYTKYKLYVKQQRISGSSDTWVNCVPTVYSYDGDGTQTPVIVESASTDCGYTPPIEPQYRWTATTGYMCSGTSKMTKEVYQVSYDSGSTWQNVVPEQTRAALPIIESASTDCGYYVVYKWEDVSGEYTCSGCTKYQKTQKYISTDGGTTWSAVSPAEYGLGDVIEQGSEYCGCSTQYRWYTLPSTQYICSGYTKYYKEVYQVSYDSGSTWANVVPEQTRMGAVIESASTDCGYSGIIYKWDVTSGYTCIEVDKYEKTQKFESYNNGISWSAVTPAEYGVGQLIEANSTDCGYEPDPSEYASHYFTFVALEDSRFRIMLPKFGHLTYSYSLDSGDTWIDSFTSAYTPTITSGNKVMFKGNLRPLPSNFYGIGIADSTGRFAVEGNPLSLLYGDNFMNETLVIDTSFRNMFSGCTNLISARNMAFPDVTLGSDCYYNLFRDCTNLTTPPYILSATTLANYCYSGMFSGCTSLVTPPQLPATTLASSCYSNMFRGCTSLTTAPQLPSTTLAQHCYQSMFVGCTSLTTAPELLASTAEYQCYYEMFKGCTSLTTAPQLPATIVKFQCYADMFSGCTNLTTVQTILPATTLANYCYQEMFANCNALATVPSDMLPATTLATNCYNNMFRGCTSLVTPPQLPATTLASSCYSNMFRGCTSLTTAPELSATTLASSCYEGMFYGCTSLTTVQTVLPATTLVDGCYGAMFLGCKSLTIAPELPATRLVDGCYTAMFRECTSLIYIKAMFLTNPKPNPNAASPYTSMWVYMVGSGGTFVKNSAATWDVRGAEGVPSSWTIQTATS